MDYWEQVIIMNDHQKRRFLKQCKHYTIQFPGKKITFLFGWAFKKIPMILESAAIYVADAKFDKRKCNVIAAL
jgi:UDPglucose 6-dehydrogenase